MPRAERLTMIPPLHLDSFRIMQRVDGCRDLVGYPSQIEGIDYATDGTELLILSTRKGYLRLRITAIKELIQELEWLEDDIERRSRD